MGSKMEGQEEANFRILRDCLSTSLTEKSSTQPAKKTRKARGKGREKAIQLVSVEKEEPNDAEELAKFIDYLTLQVFTNLPASLRTLGYSEWLNTLPIQSLYSDPLLPAQIQRILDHLPAGITDTLTTYALLSPNQSTTEFLAPILSSYLSILPTPPPPAFLQHPFVEKCETCHRTGRVTYHHLIPRGVHAKVLKRGWHTEDQLNNVAWLCRACHSFVHRVASLEDLAKNFFTVERLLEREDVRRFGEWVGKVRWNVEKCARRTSFAYRKWDVWEFKAKDDTLRNGVELLEMHERYRRLFADSSIIVEIAFAFIPVLN